LPRPKHIRILCSVSLVILLCSVITLVVLGFNQLKKSAFLIVTSTVVGVQCHFFKVIYWWHVFHHPCLHDLSFVNSCSDYFYRTQIF
jgi:hypothetical protein